jgi:hypothetical protein
MQFAYGLFWQFVSDLLLQKHRIFRCGWPQTLSCYLLFLSDEVNEMTGRGSGTGRATAGRGFVKQSAGTKWLLAKRLPATGGESEKELTVTATARGQVSDEQ